MSSDAHPRFRDVDWPEFASVEALVESCFGQDCVSVKMCDSTALSGVGGGGGSDSVAAVATLNNGSNVRVFLKSCFSGSFAARVNDLIHTFSKEANFYKRILPQLLSFRKSKGIQEDVLGTFFPKCFAIGKVNSDYFIVLEDFSTRGLAVTKKEEFHSQQQVLVSLTRLAEFHATSYCLRQSDPAFVEEAYATGPLFDYQASSPPLAQYFCDPAKKHLEFFIKLFKHPASLTGVRMPSTVTLDVLMRLSTAAESLNDTLRRARLPSAAPDHAVICHGDFHMWNIAFGKDAGDVLFFDLQCGHYGSFANEVQQYISQVTTPEDRRSNLREYLGAYSDSFIDACNRMGLREEERLRPFRLNEVEAAFKKSAAVGFVFGMNYIIPRFVPELPTEVNNLNLKEDKVLLNMVQFHMDYIAECVANGTLESLDLYGK